MECPICKNTLGFNCGTCIECGYNYLNGKFEHIRVYVDDLKNIVPLDILEELIEEHKRLYWWWRRWWIFMNLIIKSALSNMKAVNKNFERDNFR